MNRPFNYGNAYEQHIASMLSTINSNVYNQNNMLNSYMLSTDKKIAELKKNKKRKRISDNICVEQDGTIILLEIYDNGDKIGVPFIVNLRGGWEVYRLKFDKIIVAEEYFALVFRNSSTWIVGKYTKNTQTGLYNYFVQSGVKFNSQISQNRIRQALYMGFAPQIENTTQTWTLTELAGWHNGKFLSAENFQFAIRQDFPRLPILQKKIEKSYGKDDLEKYLQIFQMLRGSKEKVLLQEVIVWGLLASVFAQEGIKISICLNLVFLQESLRPIFPKLLQVFNRNSTEVVYADWTTKQVRENLILCNDEILIVDAIQALGNTYQKQKVKENVEKIKKKICEDKTRFFDIDREIDCALVVMNTEILQGNTINIFVTEDLFEDVLTVENLLNRKCVESFLDCFVEFSENNLETIRRIIRKNRTSCKDSRYGLLKASWQILCMFWQEEGFDFCKELFLPDEIEWEEYISEICEDDVRDVFINVIRKEISNVQVLRRERFATYGANIIYFDDSWLFVPTKVLNEMLKQRGLLSEKLNILYCLKKSGKLKCDREGLSKKVQIGNKRHEFYIISRSFFDKPGMPSIVDLGGMKN